MPCKCCAHTVRLFTSMEKGFANGWEWSLGKLEMTYQKEDEGGVAWIILISFFLGWKCLHHHLHPAAAQSMQSREAGCDAEELVCQGLCLLM